MATRHEALLTVTVEQRRLRRRRHRRRHHRLRRCCSRTYGCWPHGWSPPASSVDAPLSPKELAAVFRSRLDPFSTPGVDRQTKPGRTSPASACPTRDRSRCGRRGTTSPSTGPCMRATSSPSGPDSTCRPNWLEPLLLHAGGIRTSRSTTNRCPRPGRSGRSTATPPGSPPTRSNAPAPGSASAPVTGAPRPPSLEREAELVAGYARARVRRLRRSSPRRPRRARTVLRRVRAGRRPGGLELRRLDGRHDLGLSARSRSAAASRRRRVAW